MPLGPAGARLALLAPLLAPVLALVACGPGEDDPGPGGVTVGEARALDEAAEMLDAQRLPADALGTLPQAPGSDAPAASSSPASSSAAGAAATDAAEAR